MEKRWKKCLTKINKFNLTGVKMDAEKKFSIINVYSWFSYSGDDNGNLMVMSIRITISSNMTLFQKHS